MANRTTWHEEDQARLEEALRLDAEANSAFAGETALVSSRTWDGLRTDSESQPDTGERTASTAADLAPRPD
ncbi:MAG TPA: hypothetical protein VES02_10370 [Dermatophilaceae bacterium]|nr:hypothetical protein [Dermatophilaceae bacterium]